MKNWKKKSAPEPLPENEVLGSEDDFAVGAGAGESATDTSEAADTGRPDTTDNFGAPDPSIATGDVGAAAIDLAGEREKYLRLAAEYDNFRKRSAKERQDAGGRAQADLVRQPGPCGAGISFPDFRDAPARLPVSCPVSGQKKAKTTTAEIQAPGGGRDVAESLGCCGLQLDGACGLL